jgi:hypothetical protein
MPVTTRGENHIAFACRLPSFIRIDHADALEDDEELVGIMVTVSVMSSPRGEKRPPQEEVIRAGIVLVDQELNLHVHPTFIPIETRDQGDVYEPGTEWLHHDKPLNK